MRLATAFGLSLLGCSQPAVSADLGVGDLTEPTPLGDLTTTVVDLVTPSDLGPGDLGQGWLPIKGVCTKEGWCWENPLPQGNYLKALWSFSANDVWAAGEAGTVLHYDGTEWTRINHDWDDTLVRMWGSAPDDLWFVGDSGTTLHWDGSRISRISSGTQDALYGLWGFGRDDVWAGGDKGTLLHWQGGSWTLSTLPVSESISGLWGSAADNLWAALYSQGSALYHWDGIRWSAFGSSGSFYTALWGTSTSDIVALGRSPQHWGGASWNPMMTVPQNLVLPRTALWGGSPTNYWAVSGNRVARWEGTSWKGFKGPNVDPDISLEQLTAVEGGAGGIPQLRTTSHRLHEWDGNQWKTYGGGSRASLNRGWAANNNEAWIAGVNGLLHRLNDQWEWVPMPATVLYDVWGSAANDFWAVGSKGSILHGNGRTWTKIGPTTQATFNRISGTNSKNVMAVGTGGSLYKWDGTSWKSQQIGTTEDLYSIWFANENDIWVGGKNGLILHWDGAAWQTIPSRTNSYIWDLWGVSKDDLWAGGDGLILHWNGILWSSSFSFPKTNILSLWAPQKNDVWAIGDLGNLFHWDGLGWIVMPRLTNNFWSSVFGWKATGRMWISGNWGNVLVKNP